MYAFMLIMHNSYAQIYAPLFASPKFLSSILGSMVNATYIRSIVIVNIVSVNVGICIGWTPWLLRSLKQSSSMKEVTMADISWIASVPFAGNLIGGIIVLFVGNRIGRKIMLICAILPLVCGWVFLLIFNTLWTIYLTRIVMGIGNGMCFSLIPMYLSEIAAVNHRGMITSSQSFFTDFGLLLMHIHCAFIPLNDVSIFPIVLLLVSGVLLFTVPETPYYLVLQENVDGAKESLKQFREVFEEKELQMIVNHVKGHSMQNNWTDLFLIPYNRKVLLIVTLLVITNQFTSNKVITSYINDILIVLGKDKIIVNLIIACGVVMCIGTFCSMLLLDSFGRKSIFLLSVSGCGVASTIIATCDFLREKNYHADTASDVGIGGIILFLFMAGLGQTSILTVITSEVFPTNVRTFGVAYQFCLTTTCCFVVTKTFGVIMENIGVYETFFIFIVFSIATILLGIFLLPETKRKTFDEIRNILAGKSSLNSKHLVHNVKEMAQDNS